MTRVQKWLLPAACAALVVTVLSQAWGMGGALFAALIGLSGGLLMLVHRGESAAVGSSYYGFGFAPLFLLGSVVVGALYFLFVTTIRPSPGPLNLLWMLGLPVLVGLLLRPRPIGLALGLPLAVAGSLWLFAAAVAFQLPLD